MQKPIETKIHAAFVFSTEFACISPLLSTVAAIPKVQWYSWDCQALSILPASPSSCLLTQGQRLMELWKGCSRSGHSSRSPGLRPKKSTEDKANIGPDSSSYKLDWKTKEEELNGVGVPAPELSSTEAASLSSSPFSLTFSVACTSNSVYMHFWHKSVSCDSWLIIIMGFRKPASGSGNYNKGLGQTYCLCGW